MTLKQFARTVREDWKNISPYAEPYVEALSTLNSWDDKYYMDDAMDLVARFLCNAGGWRGQVARDTKDYLRSILEEAV